MKRPQIIVVLLAVLLVAAGAWFLLRGRGEKAAAKEVAVTRTDGGVIGASRGSGGPAEASQDRGGERAILIDDDPVGTLVLEGQVIDDAKDGVGGATVVISSNPPRTATTEADGSFSFDKLVGRAYQIEARADAGVAGPITSRLTATSDPVILQLTAASSVKVEVVDDKGAALDGATVELRGLDVQSATTSKGVASIAPVVPGGYQLAAYAPGYARSYAWIQVAGAETSSRIALRRGASVAGRVVDEAGAAVAGARVSFGGASDWSVQADDRLDGQLTGADGRFKFEAVGAGSMRFDARHPDHAPGTSAIVTLDGTTPVDDVEIVLPDGATISGVVVDGGGNPVASARVRVGVAGAGFISAGPRQVFSDEQGAWQVKGMPERKLEAVAIADTGSSATTPIDATAGDVAGVKLLVDQTGTIAGIVVDPSGEPIEGVQVSAGPDFRSGGGGDMASFRLRGFPEELTDSGGRFTITGLAAGNYRVRASRSGGRGRGGFGPGPGGGGVTAKTGDTNVRIELPLDGAIAGKIAFDDGTAPTAFTIAVPFNPEPFATKDGSFTVDELAPGDYDVQVKGVGFAPKVVKAKIEGGKTTDLGTITVVKGRTIRGVVTANGAPVPGATVYIGQMIFGNGSSNKAEFGGPPGAADTKNVVTDDNGGFSISGFARRDITIVAEHEEHGRSKPLRLVPDDPAEQSLQVPLQPFGSLSGVVKSGGQIVEGNIVNVQSTTAPGAMYGVASGADGAFRLDRLAPDTYKVSAMTGMNPMRGMGFFSKTVTITSGQETKVDVSIEKGTITLTAMPKAPGGAAVSGMSWIASGVMTARNGKELNLKLAAQGEGFSTFTVMLPGQGAKFRELLAGKYSVCMMPLPTEVTGMQGMSYAMRHGEDLPAFCQTVSLTASPDEQSMTVDVEIPAVIPDE